MDFFGNPECIAVVARKPLDQGDSLPAYLVPSNSLVDYLERETNIAAVQPFCLKIVNSGNCEFPGSNHRHRKSIITCLAFRKFDTRRPSYTPICIRAPEVTLYDLPEGKICSDWNQPMDVWAAGYTVSPYS